ncbi:phosphoribosyltransferase [Leptospira santarosai]|uniref:phosphoribosyltransferase n=1 Tax=Leptospira santarosai TaxID=28183 RepID=UPI0024AFE029|nr:phosphoribosyltransferase [Leptospira santarosai]MDI7202044.1 phosphoribosyltransferase [Leptospira santarosai]
MSVYSFNILGLSSELSVYDRNLKYGYLARYFTPVTQSKQNSFMTVDEYRKLTYSPNILDFKEGRHKAIDFFVFGMRKFLDNILELHNESNAILIPVPSSKAKNDPIYNDQPKGVKFNRNRDDRNIIFVNRICKSDSKYKCVEAIYRVSSKKEKERIAVDEYVKDLEVHHVEEMIGRCVILIDDVRTNGTTFNACTRLLKDHASPSQIIAVAMGETRPHNDFKVSKDNIMSI